MGDIFLKLINERNLDCPKMLKKRSHELHTAARKVTMNVVRRAQLLACPPYVCRVYILFRVESDKSGIPVSAEHAFVIGKLYSFDKVYYFSYVSCVLLKLCLQYGKYVMNLRLRSNRTNRVLSNDY